MKISPKEEKRLYKEIERLERKLEISEELREQERNVMETLVRMENDNNSWKITLLAGAFVITFFLLVICYE